MKQWYSVEVTCTIERRGKAFRLMGCKVNRDRSVGSLIYAPAAVLARRPA